MKLAFYKGNKKIFNKIVRWWDNGPYSHVEIVLDDGMCLSSSFMDGGVRAKRIVFDAGKWDFIDLHGVFDEHLVLDFYQCNKDVKYDTLGTLGFIIGPTEQKDKLFCSEFCMAALGFENAWRISPNCAFEIIKWHIKAKGLPFVFVEG